MKNSIKPIRINGELFWSKWMGEFNTKFGDTTKYECTIGNLSEKAKEALEGMGIKVKYKDNMGNYIVAKSKFKFEPVDEKENNVEVDTIGNGSKCVALVSAYEHRMSKQHGLSPSVKSLVVTELKTYIPEGQEQEEDIVL